MLIEVNARVGSASVLANQATGGRLFTSILLEACGGISEGDPDDYREGLQLSRYWGEIYHQETNTCGFFPNRDENR
jgi:hypothetical protein